jgi:hypothetical protein
MLPKNQGKDVREGLPSASMIDRLYACPGSHKMCQDVVEFRDPKVDAWAEFGERVHLWMQFGNFVRLSPEELDIAEQCQAQLIEILQRIGFGGSVQRDVIQERRFWLIDANGRRRMSGQVDYAEILAEIGVVVDFKSGRGQYDEAPKNLQLRANGVLLWIANSRKIQPVHVALIQPLAGKPTMATYTLADLEQAEKQLYQILDAAEAENAPLVAGTHCKYCPAKIKCPEARRVVGIAAGINPKALPAGGEELASILEICVAAEPIIKAIKAHVKQALKLDPSCVPGWQLGKPSNMRTLEDVVAVWEKLHAANLLDQDTFLRECVSIGIGDLEKAVATHLGMKPKEAKETINNHLAPFIINKPKEASLEKIE